MSRPIPRYGQMMSRMTATERRAQLVEIARTVFAKRGYEGTSVEEIAARAKVSSEADSSTSTSAARKEFTP